MKRTVRRVGIIAIAIVAALTTSVAVLATAQPVSHAAAASHGVVPNSAQGWPWE